MAEESIYDRSAWGYVFERVCHAESPYTANQRLVLLALAKHMGPVHDGRRVCFVNYRTLERETGLKRTAIKSAVKGIKAIEPAILKFERPAKGKKLVTNGRPHGCYRFTLLHTRRHQPGQPGDGAHQLGQPQRAQPADSFTETVHLMMAARTAQLKEFMDQGMPKIVADFLLKEINNESYVQEQLKRLQKLEGSERVQRSLAASGYRDSYLTWRLRYDSSNNGLGRFVIDSAGSFDMAVVLEAARSSTVDEASSTGSTTGSSDDPREGR
jgi:hypothetical protein